jgi:RecA-family ATPase
MRVVQENINDFSATAHAPGDDEPDKRELNVRSAGWRSHVCNAADLRRMTFPEVPFVVAGLILEGLTILAGRPKIGKSWLALAVCLAVAQGHRVLGNLATTQGDVLYAALEDNPRRLQKRIDKLLSPFSAEWPARLTLATSWRRLDDGGVDDIAEWAASVSNPRLVVLDTLAGVRPPKQNGEALYDADYRALVELHRLAAEKGFAVLVLHHTRKAEADDPLDTISGTLGLVGCADTALVLARASGGTTLYVRGRDLEEREDAIVFDREGCSWTIQGEAAEVRQSDTRKAIFAVLAKSPEPLSPKDIADEIGLHHDNVRQTLRRMTSDGEIFLVSRGKYSRSPPPVTTVTPSQQAES